MFKSLKQKIATGQEGVSPGRQTPLRGSNLEQTSKSAPPQPKHLEKKSAQNAKSDSQSSTPVATDKKSTRRNSPHDVLARVQQLLEVGKAQAENNGLLDQQGNTSADLIDPLGAASNHTPSEAEQKDDSGRIQNLAKIDSAPSTPKVQKALDFSSSSAQSTPSHDKSDVELDTETSGKINSLSHEELVRMFQKQTKTLNRYKTRFSEVVDAYKSTQKEKEKLENAMTSSQDKQLRRIKELKETIDLEQQAKRHMEETMRLSLEEKEEMIKVLEEKVSILKQSSNSSNLSGENQEKGSSSHGISNEKVDELKEKIEKQSKEIDKFKNQLRSAQEVIVRLEQEKKTAIQEIMENMQKLVADKNDLKAELILQRDENKAKAESIGTLHRKQENMRKEIEKELREEILEQAILRQEKEMQSIYQKKEDELKITFTDKIKEFQKVMDQKQDSLQSKDEEIEKLNSKISNLVKELKETGEKENNAKAKIQSLVKERGEWEKKYYDANTKVEEEEAKMNELVQQHNRQLKLKQDEQQQQIQKVKRASMNKINELQETIKQNEAKIIDIEASFSKDMENKQKEQESQKHVEISKATRKYESKINDMKKMIKELRNTVTEKEEMVNSCEVKLAEIESKGKESEGIVADFQKRIDELTNELEEKNIEIAAKESKLQDVIEDSEVQIQNAKQEYELSSKKQNEEVSELKRGLTSWEQELKEIEAKYKASEDELMELKNLNSNYKKHNEKLEGNLRDSEKWVEEVKLECSALKIQLEEFHQEKGLADGNLLLKYEEDVQAMKEELENSRKELDQSFEIERRTIENQYRLKMDASENCINEANVKIESLINDKRKLEEDFAHVQDEFQKERADSNELRKNLEAELTKARCDLERLNSAAKENEQNLENQVSILQNELGESEARLSDVSRQLDGKRQEIESLEVRLHNAQEGVSENIKKMQDDLHKKAILLVERERELEKEKEDRARERKKWENESRKNHANLEKLEEVKKEEEAARKAVDAKLEEMADLRVQEERIRNELLEVTNSFHQLQENHRNLKNEYTEMKKKNDEYEDQIRVIKEDYTTAVENSQSAIGHLEDTKNSEIDALERKLKTVEDALSASKFELEESKLKMLKAEKDMKIEMDGRLEEAKQRSSNSILALEKEMKDRGENHQQALEKSQQKHKQLEMELMKLAENDMMYKIALQNMEKAHEESSKQIANDYELKMADASESSNLKIDELVNRITELENVKIKLEERLTCSEKQSRDNLLHLKEKENDLKKEVEDYRSKLNGTCKEYTDKVAELETELMNSRTFANELQMKVLSGESNSQELDAKFQEIMEKKRLIEEKHIKREQELSESMKEKEMLFDEERKHLKDEISRKEEELISKSNTFEKHLELRLSDQSKELGEQNKNKLLEMKKKAESKIGNLKKQHAVALEQKDNKISELISAIEELRSSMENASTTKSKMAADRLEEIEQEKNNEIAKLHQELVTTREDIQNATSDVKDLQDRLERKTVEKMDALKRQKEELTDENEGKVEKLKKEFAKKTEDMKRKYEAQIEDKEYEYTSRVKAVIKEFQGKLSDKDREHEENLDDTLERMQKEEQRVVAQYEEEINELKRELMLRDNDMEKLKRDTNDAVQAVEDKIDEQRKAHEEAFLSLEREYDGRIHEMAKRHEENLENAKAHGKELTEQHQGNVNDMEQKYLSKIAEMEENHKKEKANVEKKLKIQMKKNQSEMKKLLAEKGALPTGKMNREGEDWELMNHLPNNNGSVGSDQSISDLQSKIGMLTAELTAYRERERSLKVQLEASPRNARPDSLNISTTMNTSLHSSPSTPEPVEYEYLKNILFQYMMGKQRKQMAKVLGAIVHFSPAQIKQVLDNEDRLENATAKYNNSWF